MNRSAQSNDTIIHNYQTHLKQALGLHEKTIDAAIRHIRQFEKHIGLKAFGHVHRDDIIAFKESYSSADGREKALAATTIVHCFGNLKAFLRWLIKQPGYRSMRLDLPDYFTPEKRLVKIANSRKERQVPTMNDLVLMAEVMPDKTLLNRRDRAVFALMCLSGIRDGALASLRMKHADIERKIIFQYAEDVKTKQSKTMRTTWFPTDQIFETIFVDWHKEMLSMGARDEAPLFPRSYHQRFSAAPERVLTLDFTFYQSSDHARKVVRQAAELAGVVQFTPHAIRTTIGRRIAEWGITAAERKAMSQNLGHDHYATTETYYGTIEPDEQHRLMLELRNREDMDDLQEFFVRFAGAPSNIRDGMKKMLGM